MRLGEHKKQLLLENLKFQKSTDINTLKRLLDKFEDLSINDLKGVVPGDDIIKVKEFIDKYPESTLKNYSMSLYNSLREDILVKMKQNPCSVYVEDIKRYIESGIFTKEQLIHEGLMTNHSWSMLHRDRNTLPNILDLMNVLPSSIQAESGSTDVYFFAPDGVGQSCVYYGLAGAEGMIDDKGQSLVFNKLGYGGAYVSVAQKMVALGMLPTATYGYFLTFINGKINRRLQNGRIDSIRFNLFDMGGSRLFLNNGNDVSLSNIGAPVIRFLLNDNRKVFFILVDPSFDRIVAKVVELVKDKNGNVTDEIVRKKYITQLSLLNTLVGLFGAPENQNVMNKVDAIHFLVTKADLLGDRTVRDQKAYKLINTKYCGVLEFVKDYCRQTGHINQATNFIPQIYTFSIGKFYIGGIYDYDPADSLKIIDVIGSSIPQGREECSFWRRLWHH